MILKNPLETQVQILHIKGKNRIDFLTDLGWDLYLQIDQKKVTSL